MASLSDILTSAQNLVQAVNGVANQYLVVQGAQGLTSLSVTTLLRVGAGRVGTVIVTTAGSAVGALYDTNAASSTANKFYVIPNTVGVYVINFPVSNGLVATPGTGQVISVSYS